MGVLRGQNRRAIDSTQRLDCFEQRDVYFRRHLTTTCSFSHESFGEKAGELLTVYRVVQL